MKGSGKPSAGPLPALLRPLGPLASRCYGIGVDFRNQRFDSGRRVAVRLPVPVISVGNISVGGTGKTPMTTWVAQRLLEIGLHPIIAMRGYGARTGELSDEQMEYASRFADDERVCIVANPRRAAAIAAAIAEARGHDCVILDDGFQHRQVARDLDIVLVDATRSPFEDRLLPAGWLREPASSLDRADVVAMTRSDIAGELESQRIESGLRAVTRPGTPIVRFAHCWSGIRIQEQRQDVAWLAGRHVLVLSGIGNPDAFLEMVELHGALATGHVVAPDHMRYDSRFVLRLIAAVQETDAEAVVTTEKDWVKLRLFVEAADFPVPVARPVLELRVIGGREQDFRAAIYRAVAAPVPAGSEEGC